MIEILLSDNAIIIYELVVILIMAILIVKFSKEKHAYLKSTDISQQREKHNRLNQKLTNIKENSE